MLGVNFVKNRFSGVDARAEYEHTDVQKCSNNQFLGSRDPEMYISTINSKPTFSHDHLFVSESAIAKPENY